MTEPVLVASDVSVAFGGNRAVDKVSLEVVPGEIFGLMGPNGAGKSTLLRAVIGLQDMDSGSIRFAGADVSKMTFSARCKRGIGLTFQIPQGAPELTVEEELVAQSRRIVHKRLPSARGELRRVADILDWLDLAVIARRRTDELTLGEVRRFELARAMVNEPALLLVDEPSSGMSGQETTLLASALRRVADRGVGIVLVEHNIPFMTSLAGKALVLDAGAELANGPMDEIVSSSIVQEAYLGTATASR